MRRALAAAMCALLLAVPAAAQQMPNPKEISGVPLPATDVPAGTVSVRVVRGAFTSNVTNQPVEFTIDGKKQTKNTDADGRAVVSGLKPGTKLRAVTVVDGTRIESQEITIGDGGFRVVLVGVDPEAEKRAAEDKALAEGPAVKGAVVFGPESRVIAELADDRLNMFYVVDVLNTARTPIDTGGPLIINLPHDARSASLLQGSSFQATLTGGRVTVTGPFSPGTTSLQVGFELPHDGPARAHRAGVASAARAGDGACHADRRAGPAVAAGHEQAGWRGSGTESAARQRAAAARGPDVRARHHGLAVSPALAAQRRAAALRVRAVRGVLGRVRSGLAPPGGVSPT